MVLRSVYSFLGTRPQVPLKREERLKALENVVLEVFNIARAKVYSKGRKKEQIEARQAMMYYMYHVLEMGQSEVGRYFSNCGNNPGKPMDHTTIRFGYIAHQNRIDTDPEFQEKHQKITDGLYQAGVSGTKLSKKY